MPFWEENIARCTASKVDADVEVHVVDSRNFDKYRRFFDTTICDATIIKPDLEHLNYESLEEDDDYLGIIVVSKHDDTMYVSLVLDLNAGSLDHKVHSATRAGMKGRYIEVSLLCANNARRRPGLAKTVMQCLQTVAAGLSKGLVLWVAEPNGVPNPRATDVYTKLGFVRRQGTTGAYFAWPA